MWIKHDDTALNLEIVLVAAINKTNTEIISTIEIKDTRIMEAMPLTKLYEMVKGIISKEWESGLPMDDLRQELRSRYVFSKTLINDFIGKHGKELALEDTSKQG